MRSAEAQKRRCVIDPHGTCFKARLLSDEIRQVRHQGYDVSFLGNWRQRRRARDRVSLRWRGRASRRGVWVHALWLFEGSAQFPTESLQVWVGRAIGISMALLVLAAGAAPTELVRACFHVAKRTLLRLREQVAAPQAS